MSKPSQPLEPETPIDETSIIATNIGIPNATNAALQMALQNVERTLTSFELPGMFSLQGADSSTNVTPPKGFEPFRQWLLQHYADRCGNWPPEENASSGHWLNNENIGLLEKDFGALYEYLVDRDVQWGTFHSYDTDYKILVNMTKHESLGDDLLSYTCKKLMVTFDHLHGLLHIPHPLPLLTRAPTGNVKGWSSSGGLPAVVSSPTNFEKLDVTLQSNELVMAFQNYEKTAPAATSVARDETRTGQWILVYGIMQSLSLVTSRLPALNHEARTHYSATPTGGKSSSLGGNDDVRKVLQTAQKKSYCWKAPKRWEDQRTHIDSHPNHAVPPSIVVATGDTSWDHGARKQGEETTESSTDSVCIFRAEEV